MPSKVESGWNGGEVEMHDKFKVSFRENPTASGLPQRYHGRIMQSPLVALGTLDNEGRPWTTIWGGERGFARAVAEDVLGLNSTVSRFDPVFEILWGDETGSGSDAVVEMNRLMSGLSIDPETRDRVKLIGDAIAGAVVGDERVQLAFHISGSLGNCPKYISRREIVPHDVGAAKLEAEGNNNSSSSGGLRLGEAARRVLDQADMFFMSTTDGESMDTNIRGGKPGFVRVLRNEDDVVELVYPEYSGNRLYQSLGNMRIKPLAGLVIPDFETGDVLYVTGSTTIFIGEEASSLIARSNLAVKLTVTASRLVRSGLPFRASLIDYSPYNPPVRYLVSEKPPDISEIASLSATLTKREPLTPTVSRFTFRLSSEATWQAGQHITLDFGPELEHGYAHMNDSDPQSLNDDYVRTFTVSSVPAVRGKEQDLQITARKHGPATGLLWRHNLRVPLALTVMGFGGKEEFHMPVKDDGRRAVMIAGGVGITPLLAQGQAVLDSGAKLSLVWSLKAEDMALAEDTLRGIPGLAQATRLFVSGSADADAGEALAAADSVKQMGATIEPRRVQENDLASLKGTGSRFFLCAPPRLVKQMNSWLEGEDVAWEDFGY